MLLLYITKASQYEAAGWDFLSESTAYSLTYADFQQTENIVKIYVVWYSI